MLSKSLSKRCSDFDALASQIQQNKFSSVFPSSKLKKLTEACLIAVLSGAIMGGYAQLISLLTAT